jgi:hypothetical protein
MFDDPIVAETRLQRDSYAASFGYDLTKIVADLQARQGKDGRRVVDRRKKAEQNDAPKPPNVGFTDGASTATQDLHAFFLARRATRTHHKISAPGWP